MDTATATIQQPQVAARSRFKLLTVEDLKNQPSPEWLLSGVLVAGAFAVLYGPPGIGKTFLALNMALSIATGTAGFVAAFRSGPVVYVAAEGVGGLRSRLLAWEARRDMRAENLYVLAEPVVFMDPKDLEAFFPVLETLPRPPVLIVIDTMARCCVGGDENSAKDMGQFIRGIDAVRAKIGCAVLVVHHGTKKDGRVERGSGALRGAADTMLYLDRHGESLRLSCEKQKDAQPFQEQFLRLRTVELPSGETSCVVEREGYSASPFPTLTEYEAVLQGIVASAPAGLAHHELRDRFKAQTRRSKSTFDRTLRNLITRGLVRTAEDGRYVWQGECQVSEQCHNGVKTPEAVSSVSHPLGVIPDTH